MTLQDVFYLTATFFLLFAGVSGIYIFYQILKFLEFIRRQKEHGREVLMTAFQTKYAVQIALLKFAMKFLKGGDKNG